ncbi:Glucose/ribitol dehydrogenase [Artemisia annua]|uniref:Glucose/ribitol dehydrogenase n=1 Tax=Artemisia annua TaxID=35608 RepID=A0A2U1NKZ1_ARTAN|nr:Glucose/ribitol dehydrogenase [Artemisia annua]
MRRDPVPAVHAGLGGEVKEVAGAGATICYVVVHPDLKGASRKYFLDYNEGLASNFATDPELAKKIWDYTHDLVNSLPRT